MSAFFGSSTTCPKYRALKELAAVARQPPRRAAVVRPVQAAALRFDDGVDATLRCRRRGDADPTEYPVWQAVAGQALPRRAAVRRAVEPTAGPAAGQAVGRAAGLPQRREKHHGVSRVKDDVDTARGRAVIQDLLPRRPTVGRPKDAALLVRTVHMSECSHKDRVRIARVNSQAADVAGVGQPDVRPGLAPVPRCGSRRCHGRHCRGCRPRRCQHK